MNISSPAPVSNSNAVQLRAGVRAVLLALDNRLGQRGHVDSSIGLTSDKEGIGLILWEQLEEFFNSKAVFQCGAIVVACVVQIVAV